MQTVEFINMEDGTGEDYALLESYEARYNAELPARIMAGLRKLEDSFSGYKVDRLVHSLQGATRAYRAGESDEFIVAVLLHDIGDDLAPYSHSELAAAVLRPFVSEKLHWIVKHHGLFQMYYYAHHTGGDRNARDAFKDHPWYREAIDFCHNYDQNCFDPDYDHEPLEFFEPILRRVLANPKFEQTAAAG
jgi:predicted HD phosphohydrolase